MAKDTSYILTSTVWSSNNLLYSFYKTGQDFSGTAEKNLKPLPDSIRKLVRQVLKDISLFVDINFTETSDGSLKPGCLMYANSSTPDYAYAYLPPPSQKAMKSFLMTILMAMYFSKHITIHSRRPTVDLIVFLATMDIQP